MYTYSHMDIGIIGATGLVGKEILRLLEKRSFPCKTVRLFGSEKSVGKKVSFKEKEWLIEALKEKSFLSCDLLFFAAGADISKKYLPWIDLEKTIVIDSSSAFRMDKEVPLIIPEINASLLKNKKLISSPNCVASIIAMAIYPLFHEFGIKRIIATAFQAASGGGKKWMQKLIDDTHLALQNKSNEESHFYGFNLFSHTSEYLKNGYVEEEKKVMEETKKILQASHLKISITSIRVPIQRAHSLSLNIECEKKPDLNQIYALLENAGGIKVFEDKQKNLFASPFNASHQDEVYVGRLRIDQDHPHSFEMWVVADQLLKGAALNSVQIAETLYNGNYNEILEKT